MIQIILDRVPENQFTYNNKTYTGSKVQILESLKKDLEEQSMLFQFTEGEKVFILGKEKSSVWAHATFNLDIIKTTLIKEALDKVTI